MECTRCHAEVGEGAQYCTRCGAAIEVVPERPLFAATRGLEPKLGDDLDRASMGQRFVNFVVDWFAGLTFSIVVMMPAIILIAALDPENAELSPGHELLARAAAMVGFWAYFVLCEASIGRTIGKLLTGTRVVRLDGSRPDLSTIMRRSAARLVPFEPLSGFSSSGPWHDRWTDTAVVRIRPGVAA
jgi:uncharacterized RDD family membrane protein YckC